MKPGGPVLDCPGESRAHPFIAGFVVGASIVAALWCLAWLSQTVPT